MENRIEIVYTYDLVAIRQLDAKKWSEVIENRMSETTVSTYADSQKSRSIQRSSPALPRFPPSRSATSDNTTRMTTTLILLLHDVCMNNCYCICHIGRCFFNNAINKYGSRIDYISKQWGGAIRA
uniref:Uncharacterized protein n=1 Tax=Panagrellus redivivus TaxID=6233 RepID=A0A7E4V3J9_PANRE